MPLSWNEIKTRAAAFVHDWQGAARERAEAQSFWNAFLHVFGVHRRRVASFEANVEKVGGRTGFIDLLWPGVLAAEHKSRGKDLDAALRQALDYLPGLTDDELPRYVLASDFARLRLRDLDTGDDLTFPLADLLDHIERFGFIAGYEKRRYDEQDPVNVEAAAKMGALHDRLRAVGYAGHDLEVYLVRLLFCLFAEDTGIFSPRGAFEAFVEERTRADGSDLGPQLAALFQTLNTPPAARQTTLDEQLAAFPYVNGQLFAERLATAHFDGALRTQLLDACRLDWGAISPAIFGSMFQSAMDAEARRHLGAHYTSEQNILKLIGPLFLDDLRAAFERVQSRNSRPALKAFHDRLAALRLFDPACGCGNFLVIAYRELRRLEIEVVRALYADTLQRGQRVTNIADLLQVHVGQCFGLEVEEFPAQIAQVALWLTDHQMNLEVAAAFGTYFTRLPLRTAARVRHGNALTLDWAACFDDDQPEAFDFILGNPPFLGKKEQSKQQKANLKAILRGIKGAGVLDFASGWYVKAAKYMQDHPATRTAFVSTKSISQGEQVGILWNELFATYGATIHFAHRTFRWDNEAPGRAAVHCVIVGFALHEPDGPRRLFDYETVRGEPHEKTASNISPYLVEGNDVVVLRRRKPICNVPKMVYGSKPVDGGNLLLSPEEREDLIKKEPRAADYILPFIGSYEFINDEPRFCLWLKDVEPQKLRQMLPVMERIEGVREMRSQSSKAATQRMADFPMLFAEDRHHGDDYLAIPEVSSSRRDYIPVGYMPSNVIASNKIYTLPSADRYLFGILASTMHMAWVRLVGGRLKSDYQYSSQIVYNNFPWPEQPTEAQRERVAAAAADVLAARRPHLAGGATLADLYDPLAMPPALVKVYRALDRAVDRAYRRQPFTTETNRVAYLFARYEALTNALFAG